jgi:hypothetical protein
MGRSYGGLRALELSGNTEADGATANGPTWPANGTAASPVGSGCSAASGSNLVGVHSLAAEPELRFSSTDPACVVALVSRLVLWFEVHVSGSGSRGSGTG